MVIKAYRMVKEKMSTDRSQKIAKEIEDECKIMDEVVAAIQNSLHI